MNVEIGAEAALFPEKKYINGIAVTVLTGVGAGGGGWQGAKSFDHEKKSLALYKPCTLLPDLQV
jgi:hypothetical protein